MDYTIFSAKEMLKQDKELVALRNDGRQTGVIGSVCHAAAFFDGNDHFL